MLQIVSDMERISDYCENISEFAESLLEKQVDFSEVGVEHLNKMLDVCIASYLYALEAFESNDRESALKTIEKETEADGLEISLRAKHIKRLTNQQCNTEAGVVFLDSLVCPGKNFRPCQKYCGRSAGGIEDRKMAKVHVA